MISQQLANTIITAAGYILIGMSFSIVFRICGFLNVSHAVPYVVGPYSALVVQSHGASLPLAIVVGITAAAASGVLMNISIFCPLRRRYASSLILLVSSLGVYVVCQNLISLFFGERDVNLCGPNLRVFTILGTRTTSPQIALIAGATVVAFLIMLILKKSKFGIAYRSVASDPELAEISGIPATMIGNYAFALGSAIAGLAGIMMAMDTGVRPGVGLDALLIGVVVVIIGGRNVLIGVVPAAFIVSAAQTLGLWRNASQWQSAIAFAILLMFLLARPQGIFGKDIVRPSNV